MKCPMHRGRISRESKLQLLETSEAGKGATAPVSVPIYTLLQWSSYATTDTEYNSTLIHPTRIIACFLGVPCHELMYRRSILRHVYLRSLPHHFSGSSKEIPDTRSTKRPELTEGNGTVMQSCSWDVVQ